MTQQTLVDRSTIRPGWVWAARATALIAAAAACFVSWKSVHGGSIPGCDVVSIFDCDHVLKSRWSRWLGIPVGILGAGTYLLVLLASSGLGRSVPPQMRRFSGLALTSLLSLAVLCGIWFSGLQFIEIGKICPYCLLSHACGLLTAVFLMVGYVRQPLKTAGWTGPLSMVIFALIGFLSLLFGQYKWPHETFEIERYDEVALVDSVDEDMPGSAELQVDTAGDFDAPEDFTATVEEVFSAPTEDEIVAAPNETADEELPEEILQKTFTRLIPAERLVRFSAHHDPINPHRYPMLGDPAAEYIVIEMADYTCEHCREMYGHLEHVRAHYGNRIAVVVRPVALEKKCNPFVRADNPKHTNACVYAKLALAVWQEAPERFSEFHHWLMQPPASPPPVADAQARATTLIGEEALRKHVGSTQLLLMLTSNHETWNTIGKSLPLVFFGGRLIRGVPHNGDKLIEAFETIMPSLANE